VPMPAGSVSLNPRLSGHWPSLNDVVYRGAIWIHLKLDLSLTDSRTSIHPDFRIREPKPEEARSGNPLHAAAALVVMGLLGYWSWRGLCRATRALLCLAVAAATFLVLSAMFLLFLSRPDIMPFSRLQPSPLVRGARLFGAILYSQRVWLRSTNRPAPIGPVRAT
jgi:hypothetical protein